MELKFEFEIIYKMTIKQLENNFIELKDEEKETIKKAAARAIEKCDLSFRECKNKYYNRNGETFFDPFHSNQYAAYLYFLSNTLHEEYGNGDLAGRVYYLNKIMHSIDIYFEVKLPKVFFFEHPVGTVLGRGKYQDKFVVYQNCTVGGNKGKYPIIGENVTMLSYSCILGDTVIGNNCIIASHTYIKDEKIPDNSIVFGSTPNLIIKPNNIELNIY